MAGPQSSFLEEFKAAYSAHFGHDAIWKGGQAKENTAGFSTPLGGRRSIGHRAGEGFELGDVATTRGRWTVIIEFESNEIPLSNLQKYWPYIRGELTSSPARPIALCHFSDWWSYATRRDLWEWTLSRMQADPARLVDFEGRQFDHGGTGISRPPDKTQRDAALFNAIRWIEGVTATDSAEPA
ncbi:MAG: hypothetical protein ACK4JB_02700 [Reyranella sp.]